VRDVGRLVVCSVEGSADFLELPESRANGDRTFVSGGERSLYEVAVAGAALGLEVELRGLINKPILDAIAGAAGARPRVDLASRRPDPRDVIVVPEAVDFRTLATLHLSSARCVMLLLAPPGLCGWSFLPGWEPVDLQTVDVHAVGLPASFRAIAAFGMSLWTNAHGIAEAGSQAGVPIRWLGTGTPVPFPAPTIKTADVAIVEANRWAFDAEQVLSHLSGVKVHRVPAIDSVYSLGEALAPAKILLWPSRIEGMSRIAREARAVGTVPVALNTSPFATMADHGGGVVLVENLTDIEHATRALLADADRLEELSGEAVESARLQIDWDSFLIRVKGALEALPDSRDSYRERIADHLRGAWAQLEASRAHSAREAEALRMQQATLTEHIVAVEADRARVLASNDRRTAERDHALNALHAAQTDLQAAQTDLQSARTDLQSARTDLQAAQSEVAAYKGRLVVRALDSTGLGGASRALRRARDRVRR
jgi:hypothetical protein